METKPFRILSIDGGGIRGVFPAMVLNEFESKLKADGIDEWQVYHHFDLICGTSTGGILAFALSLGIPAKEILALYQENAMAIFGNKKSLFCQMLHSAHDRSTLERLMKKTFEDKNGEDYRIKDCKTNVCVPIYDLFHGQPSVLKTNHHESYTRDFHLPIYMAALATAAAPTYFDPYSTSFDDLNENKKLFSNKVDGGVAANNPTLIGIMEAQVAFKQELANIRVFSIGTGSSTFRDSENHRKWGTYYWTLKNRKSRIIDLFMQAQSQAVENVVTLMQLGVNKERKDAPIFEYLRVDTKFDESFTVSMDETDPDKLQKLAEKGSFEFHNQSNTIINKFKKESNV